MQGPPKEMRLFVARFVIAVCLLGNPSNEIFASTDISEIAPWNGVWKYRSPFGSRLNSNDWTKPTFDDADWPSLSGPFEFPSGTDRNAPVFFSFVPNVTGCFRLHFDNPNFAEELKIRCEYHAADGVVLYLNGQEIHRLNVASAVDFRGFAKPPLTSHPVTNDFLISSQSLVPGDNVIAALVLGTSMRAPKGALDFGLRLTSVPTAFPVSSLITNQLALVAGRALALKLRDGPQLGTSYQWYHNETLVVGATNADYTVPQCSISDAGLYRIRAFNSAGESWSEVARVRVYPFERDGDIDPSFQVNVQPVVPSFAPIIQVCKLLRNGQVLVGGTFGSVDWNTNYAGLARLNPDGSLDTLFAKQYFFPGISEELPAVRCIEEDSDGRIYVGGDFSSYNSKTLRGVIRLLPNGELDPSFDAQKDAPQGPFRVFTLLLAEERKVYIGGEFQYVAKLPTGKFGVWNSLLRLRETGAPDLDFLVNPLLSDGCGVFDLAYSSDKSVYAAGRGIEDYDFQKGYLSGIVRLQPSGAHDSQFTTNRNFLPEMVRIQIDTDQSIWIANRPSTFFTRFPEWALGHLNGNGQELRDFPAMFADAHFFVSDLILQTDGKLLVVDEKDSPTTTRPIELARYLKTGELDSSFRNPSSFDFVRPSVSYSPRMGRMENLHDGRFLVCGNFSEFAGESADCLIAVRVDSETPSLFLAQSDSSGIELQWHEGSRSFHLESVDRLSDDTWRIEPSPVSALAGWNRVTIANANGRRFFRLASNPDPSR